MAVADELAERFAATAVERDKRGGTAKHERDLLRQSGLLGLSVPVALGGLGAAWSETLRIVRRLAEVDSALAHLFGFHHLMLATVRLFGTREQSDPLLADTVRQAWFWGNALNPLDLRTLIVPRGDHRVLDGLKSFCSGASDSDRLIVSATQAGQERLIIAAIPSDRPGIRIAHDWDNMGQRQTDSGSVEFTGVRVEESEILRTPGPLGSVFASLRPCLAQLILANVYLGIAAGALAEAKRYTRTQRRAWFRSGVDKATDDPYVLHHYGELWLGLEGARLITDAAGSALDRAWQAGDALDIQERGACAISIAAAKASTTRAGLEVTNRMFEVMGARATQAAAGVDRYWRNLRTHTLHDPVDYKLRELGVWVLNDELPEPSFYS